MPTNTFRTMMKFCACLWLATLALHTDAGRAEKQLIDLSRSDILKRVAPSAADQVTVTRAAGTSGVVVTCRPGKGDYPGVTVTPEGAPWNLSGFGHIEARITNLGAVPMAVCLRVDNDGDWKTNPWNGENIYPKPGETNTVRVWFGYSFGKPAFALNPARIPRLLLFINKPEKEQSFRIESIAAGGAAGEKPPVKPEDVRVKPPHGNLVGDGVDSSAGLQVEAQNAQVRYDVVNAHSTVQLTLPANAADASVRLRPAQGRWDLREFLQVVVRARNTGKSPLRLKARLESEPGIADWVTASTPVPPGGTQELTLPFAGGIVTLAAKGEPTGGSAFESDRASGIRISAEGDGERRVEIESVRAVVPPPPALPAWLGKRPPVPGMWKQTMAEEFNGKTINESLWTIYHPNYWDKQAHFSKANVILDNGLLRLRFEKKRGHEDDDPSKPETDWATGFLTSTHKWTQRYGYFECRMKLPHAPGMWPAFWMMPDRGPSAGAAREDTRDGGMEFDILEYLARYGPYRYNIACHWDGYEKDHKSTGSDRLYVQPDKEGFYTAGLLWEPGRLTFYCNGAPVGRWEDARVASVPAYILFTAVSGGWGGNDLTGEDLPADFVIDYVRAWQRSDLQDSKTP